MVSSGADASATCGNVRLIGVKSSRWSSRCRRVPGLSDNGGGGDRRRFAIKRDHVDVIQCRLDTGDELTRVFRGHGFGGVDPVGDLDPEEPVVVGDLDASAGTVPRASVAAPVLGAAAQRVSIVGQVDVVVVRAPGLVLGMRPRTSVRP